MSEQTEQPRRLFAVVVNGVISPKGNIVQLAQGADNVFPVPLFIHESEEKCEQKREALLRRIRSVKFYDGPGMKVSQPILGVVPIALPPKKAGKPMSEAHKKAMQDARKKADPSKKSTVPLVPSVAGKK